MPIAGDLRRKDEVRRRSSAPQDSLRRRAYRLPAMEPQDHPPEAPTNPVARPVVAAPPRYSEPQAPPPPLPPYIPGDQPLPPDLSPRKPGGPGGGPKVRKQRRFGWGKRILTLVVLLVLAAVGIFWSWDAGLQRTNALQNYTGRIADH